MRWGRRVFAITAFAAAALAALFTVEAWRRAQLPFDEAGRFFDPSSGVVYRQQATLGWGALAGLALVACAVLFIASRRHASRDVSTR